MSRSWCLCRDRRGVALPLALFTLVIVAVMITAVFYVGRLEQRMGYNSLASTQAFEAAEAGVANVLADWSPVTYDTMTNGTTFTLPLDSIGSNSVYTASVRRLNTNLFLIQVEGRFLVAGQAVTRRQVARLVRRSTTNINPRAPLMTRIGVSLSGSLAISGHDSTPGGWAPFCPPPVATVPAVIDSAGAVGLTGGCAGAACLTTPTILIDPTVNAATFTVFGSQTFADLAASAEKTVTGTLGSLGPTMNPGSPPTCRTTDTQNWGEPWDPTGVCGNYLPLIYAPGNLTLSGGRGQGILLVQGGLDLQSGVEFYGVIVVQGNVTMSGGRIYGALMANNVVGPLVTLFGGQLTYSSCATYRVARGVSQPSTIDRNWIQLY